MMPQTVVAIIARAWAKTDNVGLPMLVERRRQSSIFVALTMLGDHQHVDGDISIYYNIIAGAEMMSPTRR